MAALKPQIASAQKDLANFDGEINEMWPLMRTDDLIGAVHRVRGAGR